MAFASVATLMSLAAVAAVCSGDVVVTTPDGQQHTFSSMSARFGRELPSQGAVMGIEVAEPRWGCGSLPPKASTLGPTAILVERGGPVDGPCEFVQKAYNAQEANYDAVIVYDDEPGQLIPMSSDEPDVIEIPAIFIGQQDGLALRDLLVKHGYNVTARLTPSADDDEWPSLMVTFTTIVASVIFLFTVFLVYRQRRYRARHGPFSRPAYTALSNVEINKLTKRKYGASEPTDATCVICLSDFEAGDTLVVLNCQHEFHKDCITPWLSGSSRTCPLCKQDAHTTPSASTPINAARVPTYDTYETV